MLQSERKVKRIVTKALLRINNASARAQGRVADRVIATLLMVTDQRKAERLATRSCKACFYLPGYSLAGQGFTEWQCLYCTNTGHHPSTAVPRVCETCSHELQLCRDCGGHLEMSIVSKLPRKRSRGR